MKKLIPVLACILSLIGCKESSHDIISGSLIYRIDDKMHIYVGSQKEGAAEIYKEYIPADYLTAREFTAKDFNLKEAANEKNGENDLYHFTGVYNENGFSIEKQVNITVSPDYPDMIWCDISYINRGEKDAYVTSWMNHNLRIDQNTDSVIWSLQASSSSRRDDWILPVTPGYSYKNFMGMNNSDYGGGIPVLDLWRKDGGIAVGLREDITRLVNMPVQMNLHDTYASLGIEYEYPEAIRFKKNDTIHTYSTFISIHKGDFFDPVRQFSKYMQNERGIKFAESEPEAYEAVWCAWGYERTFTINEVIQTLPKVKELGFKWVDVDDGFQICEGDWKTNSRFPGGDKDMRRIADEIHKHGMKAKLWWAPLAADPGSNLLKTTPEAMLKTSEGIPEYISWWDSYYLSPVNPYTKKHTEEVLKMFLKTWDFDGLKMDGQHLNLCLADHNRHSGLEYPEQSFELLPTYFENVYETARKYKPHAVIQNCPCGTAMNFFNMPYMNQAVSSDPTSSWQIRLKGKVYRAIFDQIAYYADHVELSDNGNDFPTQIGIGAVVGSKFTYPRDNPNVKESYLLTPEKEKLYKKWVGIYNDKMLSKGKYLNLYDIRFDYPETHVIEKDGKMYYAFYADKYDGEITLRGLDSGREYTVSEYTSDDKKEYKINGSSPVIDTSFEGAYLIEVF